jgi:hypothetical protein
MMTIGEARIKGLALLDIIESLKNFKGSGTVEKLFAELPTDLRDKLQYKSIVRSGWYPIDSFRQLLAAIKKVTGGKRETLRELANLTIKNALTKGVYKLIRLVLSRKAILKRAPSFFNSYIDGSTMTITEVTTTHGRVQCKNCKGFNADLWETLIGSVCGVIEVHEGRINAVKIHAGGGDNDDTIDFEVAFSWDIEID